MTWYGMPLEKWCRYMKPEWKMQHAMIVVGIGDGWLAAVLLYVTRSLGCFADSLQLLLKKQ